MDSQQLPKKPSATQLTCGCFLALLMLLVLLPGIAFLIWNERNAQEIERRLAAIRTQGLPTTFAELDEFCDLPRETKDTTQLWLDGVKPLLDPVAMKEANGLPFLGRGKIPRLGDPWDELDEAEAFLARHAASLEKFHTAAELGGAARFPVDFQAGAGANLNPVQNQRAAARLLKLESAVHAHRGDARQTAESIRSQFAVEHSLLHAPYLVSYLVQLALRGMVIDTVSETMGRVPFMDEELRSFQTELRSWSSSESLRRALATERVLVCQMYLDGGWRGSAASPMSFRFSKSDFAFYLATNDELASAAGLEYPDAFHQSNRILATARSGNGLLRIGPSPMPMVVPAINATISTTARSVAAARACETAISVVQFHRRTGKLPESLSQLTSDIIAPIPLDPFDGQPLRYRPGKDGFVVYSVGENLLDNSGNPEQEPPVDVLVFVRILPQGGPTANPAGPALERQP